MDEIWKLCETCGSNFILIFIYGVFHLDLQMSPLPQVKEVYNKAVHTEFICMYLYF